MLLYLILVIKSLDNNNLIIKFSVMNFYTFLDYFRDYIFLYDLY